MNFNGLLRRTWEFVPALFYFRGQTTGIQEGVVGLTRMCNIQVLHIQEEPLAYFTVVL